ncbi:MAG: 2-iminoacetate synthase ThiH [Spirochaetes bacterium]|nr:2-iminoacetate synthase ThiH [Spirochaetota bacterium]
MFEDLLNKYLWKTVKERIYNSSKEEVMSAIYKENKHPDDFFALLSPAADAFLEELAVISQKITRMRFGNIIQLYAPLYISNECTNSCLYCGFNRKNEIKRLTLSGEMVEEESRLLFKQGFRHILLLTGEDKHAVSPEALAKIANNIHSKFASVSIEVYPMDSAEYKIMTEAGVDGLAVYQETYDRIGYDAVHPSGMKKNFSWRLNAPERAGDAGFRKIGIGALLGLSDWRVDGFFLALHAYYLTKKYWKSQIQISFPRLKQAHGNYVPPNPVSDRDLTHLICVMRNILPDSGLLLSTRESSHFRDNVMPIGITMMSAGSKTEPGGYSHPDANARQFTIDDDRAPDEIAAVIAKKGFDPVWKDWDREFLI